MLYAGQYQDSQTGFYYLRNRYYDPATAQFLTMDPVIDLTQAPYSYTGNDPINEADPLGLWGWNPISDIAQAGGDAGQFVATHQTDIEIGAGIALGVVAAGTGIGAVFEGATITGALLSGSSIVAGFGGAALDYEPCVQGRDTEACVGLGLGATGVFAGMFGLAGTLLVLGGVIGEYSLTAAILGGASAFGRIVGINATVLDAAAGIASADALPVCSNGG